MENQQEQQTRKDLHLDMIKIVPFLTAIRNGDKSFIDKDMSQKDFENLCEKYMEMMRPEKGLSEQKAENLQAKMVLLQGCFIVFQELPADEEMMDVLRSQGYKIERETFFEDIKNIKKKYNTLEFRYKNQKERIPKKLKPKKPNKPIVETSIYDMLTGLASGLELSLNFDTMTVGEFTSWRAQLKRKQDSIKKSLNKHGGK